MKRKVKDVSFVVFDLETTGLKPIDNQIIEIAALKIDNEGNELGRFERLVKLYKKPNLDPFIVNLTGIDEELLKVEGENHAIVMEEFLEFIEDSVLVAQNTPFDISFLMEYYLSKSDMPFTRFNLDLINLSKFLFKNEETYKLSSLVDYYKVDYDQTKHHRAMYDVEITKNCFVKSLEMLGKEKELLLGELFGINKTQICSEKQASYLESLMGKKNHFLNNNDLFTKTTASYHIDFYVTRKG